MIFLLQAVSTTTKTIKVIILTVAVHVPKKTAVTSARSRVRRQVDARDLYTSKTHIMVYMEPVQESAVS